MPRIEQLFVAPAGAGVDTMALERRAFVLRKRVEHAVDDVYFPSLSARTIVYKGMLTSEQLRQFFPDLRDPTFESGLALVHSRFSTNTFPSWPLAHPYRYLCHNGEINTLAGNRNWMRAREALLETSLIDGDLSRIYPICTPGASDSASFDEVLELLHLGGRSLPHAVLMMIPEAWENHTTMDRAAARLLPLPRVAHGAVGRPGRRLLHRRHGRRRRARPQRPAPGPLLGHRRRPRRAGQRGGRPRHRARAHRAQGPAAARPHVPRRHGQGPPRRGRGDQGRAGVRAPLRRVAGRGPGPPGRAARPHHAHAPARPRRHPAAPLRLHHRGAPGDPGARWPAPAPSRSAPWARTPPSPCSRTAPACSTTTSPSSSPR